MNSFYFGMGVVGVMKELIFSYFYFGMGVVGVMKKLVFNNFHFQWVWSS